jgi:hypothetical protein
MMMMDWMDLIGLNDSKYYNDLIQHAHTQKKNTADQQWHSNAAAAAAVAVGRWCWA